MLKILHVPYTYHPDPVGGTELYVEQLVQGLRTLNFENVVVAPGKRNERYEHRGVWVQRLAVDDGVVDLSQMYGEGDADAARAFGAILDAQQPDIVHLHAFTRIVSARFAREARARNIPIVFTYHTPSVSCLRGDLMRWGSEACDGVLDADLCARCQLHSLGLPIPAATLLARAPQSLREFGDGKQSGVWTALRMRDLVERQHVATRSLLHAVDAIVALGEWTRQLLRNNQVHTDKIVVIPHGLAEETQAPLSFNPNKIGSEAARPGPLRLVALGRLERIKGLDILVRALEQQPQAPITLDIYGIVQSQKETAYARELRKGIEKDARIRLLPPVPHARVIPLLREYDLLAVPSQWFETGPLVVLEAFVAGIPVLGSNLGGVAEKVTNGVNGLLVPPRDPGAWRDALLRLSRDRGLVQQLRAGVQPPRSLDTVAREMAALYGRLARI